ncbi:1-acyl-sn-glycerol-3-phosphate acyltransferase [Spirochaeta africana DSM 8902]|uniref:1-acyl-sn-glycerol-3-phosphate acyltransferase n=2 Tax=Spirochaeta TaxID=146 RepID=H9ULZ2_SPIAZ|nr:1-acyl-sn-glycerol-3-phosphate acyltransferase [Spirochaeta africana DSM 8902]
MLFTLTCKIDTHEFDKIPAEGPGILLSNHTTNLEGPLYYVYLRSRKATALGKQELWKNPFTRMVMKAWNIIPVHRGRVDTTAMKKAMERLDQGWFLGVAAEGTRSKTGALRSGRPGAAMLAARKHVPVYPLVHWGLMDIGKNIRRFKRTQVGVKVGKPFYVEVPDGHPNREQLKEITNQMMYQLAAALPERYRGPFSDLSQAPVTYLRFVGE